MEKIILKVTGMSCSHCEGHIVEALLKIDNVKTVVASASDATVIINYDHSLDLIKVKESIDELGYKVLDE